MALVDRALGNLIARVAGSLALAAFVLHVGMFLEKNAPDGGSAAFTTVALVLVLAVAGAWAQARLDAKRAALWTSLGVNGLLPAFAGIHAFHWDASTLGVLLALAGIHAFHWDASTLGVLLALAGIFGLTTIGATAWLLARKEE